jgi:hypothetical protein
MMAKIMRSAGHVARMGENRNVRIYKTIILPVVLYGCESWSLTLTEEQGVEEDI